MNIILIQKLNTKNEKDDVMNFCYSAGNVEKLLDRISLLGTPGNKVHKIQIANFYVAS
jgi:hypothetical protein